MGRDERQKEKGRKNRGLQGDMSGRERAEVRALVWVRDYL